LQSYC